MNSPAPHPSTDGFRLFYMDDSGSPNDGHIVFAWIEVTPGCWAPGLRHWLDLRHRLYANYQVPADVELHATKLIGGRGTPAIGGDLNNSKAQRRQLVEDALTAIGENDAIKIGIVHRQTRARGRAYAQEREEVYGELVGYLDRRLEANDEYGAIVMDGDGSDPSYRRRHRTLTLAARRVIEDPFFQSSHISQWVQMADLVAWAGYQSANRHPGKSFAWGWYGDYLSQSDVNGRPLTL